MPQSLGYAEQIRIIALQEAIKSIKAPIFLGDIKNPGAIEFGALDIVERAKRFERYILNGGNR